MQETIVLVDEDGIEYNFNMQMVFEVDDRSYALLKPQDDEEEDTAIALRIEEDEEGEEILVNIEDDQEFARVAETVEELLAEEDMEE